jgi:hypothetical protein
MKTPKPRILNADKSAPQTPNVNILKYFAHIYRKSKVTKYMFAFGLLSVCFGLNFTGRPNYASMLGSYSTATLFGTIVVILGLCGFMAGDMFTNKAIQTCITAGFTRAQIYFSLNTVSTIACIVLFLIQDAVLMIFYSVRGYIFDHTIPRLILAVVMVYTLSRFATMLAFAVRNGVVPIIAGWLLLLAPQILVAIVSFVLSLGS